MDAIQAIDGTVSATLDAVRALLSGEASAPAEATPVPDSADPATMGRDHAVSASDTGADGVRAEASSLAVSVLSDTIPDTTPAGDGRATLAALAAQTPSATNASGWQGLPQAVATAIQTPRAAHSPESPPSHHPGVSHAVHSQPTPQIAVQPASQAPVVAEARAITGGSQNVLSIAAAAGSAITGTQPAAQETTWRSTNARTDVDTAAASRPLDSQVLPMPTTPLHTQAAGLQKASHLPNLVAVVREDDSGRAWHDDVEYMPEEESEDDAVQAEATDGDARAADALVFADDPDYATLRQWLIDGAQHAALRELDLHRRVILIVPSEAQPHRHSIARMHLLAPQSADAANPDGDAHSFTTRWWPGTGVRPEWTAWRLHREAGVAGTGRLQSRHPSPMPVGACALLLRLGPTPPSLLDAGSACLDVADRHRFQQALGGQWSVLALLCPRGWSASH